MSTDEGRTQKQLIEELTALRLQVAELKELESKHRRMEEVLRENEERFRSLVESCRDGILAYDKHIRYTLWNPAMERISGVKGEDVLGRNAFEAFPFLKDVGEADAFRNTLKGKATVLTVMPYNVPETGRSGYFESSHFPMYDAQGRIVGGMAIIRDVTEYVGAGEALRESEEKFRSISDSAKDAIIMIDDGERITYWNKAAEEMFGYAKTEAAGKELHKLIIPARFHEKHLKGFKRFRDTGSGSVIGETLELAALRRNGAEFPIELSLSAVRLKGRWDAVGIIRDITERKRIEEELKTRQRQEAAIAEVGQRALAGGELSALMADTTGIVARTLDVEYCEVLELLPDANALLLRAGVGWAEGYVGHTTVGTGANSQAGYTLLSREPVIVDDLHTETRFSGPSLLRDHNAISGMSVIIHGRGRPFGVLGVHTTRRRRFTGDDAYFIQAVANVLAEAIERKRMEETIKHMAYHDTLTSLPNRKLFTDHLAMSLAHARRRREVLAVMFMDLDGFKDINDTMGHSAGDQLLKEIAGRLKRCVREGDTVARLGGDEFTLLLAGIKHADNAVRVAEKILEVMREPLTLGGHEHRISASIGVALYPDDGEDTDTLLRHADTAMYRAKERGDCCRFYGIT